MVASPRKCKSNKTGFPRKVLRISRRAARAPSTIWRQRVPLHASRLLSSLSSLRKTQFGQKIALVVSANPLRNSRDDTRVGGSKPIDAQHRSQAHTFDATPLMGGNQLTPGSARRARRHPTFTYILPSSYTLILFFSSTPPSSSSSSSPHDVPSPSSSTADEGTGSGSSPSFTPPSIKLSNSRPCHQAT